MNDIIVFTYVMNGQIKVNFVYDHNTNVELWIKESLKESNFEVLNKNYL